MKIDTQGIQTHGRLISWNDLTELAIRTSSDGPWVDDLFWMLRTQDGVFEVPGSMVTGEDVGALQEHLTGLDSMKIVDAMGSLDERIFRIWHVDEAKTAWDDGRCAARFAALVARLGGHDAHDAFQRLHTAWSANERRYHNLEHLADCLRELDAAHVEQAVADVAELALWYHDAVYTPRATDNEERSALLLLAEASRLGLRRTLGEAAAACIRATAHLGGAEPATAAAALVVDVDLSILGRGALRFMDFEYAVAEEYADVPWMRYIVGRGRFLATLAERPFIFRTEHFRARYEAAARANIASLLASPRYRSYRLVRCIFRFFGKK